jgi:hypothetical protein
LLAKRALPAKEPAFAEVTGVIVEVARQERAAQKW